MHALDPRIDGWIDALVERTRVQLRAELVNLTASFGEAIERQQAEASHEARAAAEAAANAFVTEAIAAERLRAAQLAEAQTSEARAAIAAAQDTIDRLTAEIAEIRERTSQDAAEAARQQAGALAGARAEERQAELDAVSALGEAYGALDDAETLSALLGTLLDHAARRVNRSALLVVRGAALRGWDWRGFTNAGAAAALEVLREDRTPVARAWTDGIVEVSRTDEVAGHVLAPCTEGRVGVAVPIAIDGQVIAVLYADDEGEPRQVPSAWPEHIGLLTRYAGRCLELLTVRRMPDLLRASAAERARAQVAQHDEESAQRYARLLVAEIRLYHEAALDEARREGDIMRRLRPQIERARALYNERVPAAQRARTSYFDDELVRTLAGGDQALLGQST